MKLRERYNSELNWCDETMRFGQVACAFEVNFHNLKPEFWGLLPAAIVTKQPVANTRDQQHF
ncbi:MAG: hypothetical protein U0Y68_18915 [Blastocatellia bacterium]